LASSAAKPRRYGVHLADEAVGPMSIKSAFVPRADDARASSLRSTDPLSLITLPARFAGSRRGQRWMLLAILEGNQRGRRNDDGEIAIKRQSRILRFLIARFYISAKVTRARAFETANAVPVHSFSADSAYAFPPISSMVSGL